MFTGLVSGTGTVVAIDPIGAGHDCPGARAAPPRPPRLPAGVGPSARPAARLGQPTRQGVADGIPHRSAPRRKVACQLAMFGRALEHPARHHAAALARWIGGGKDRRMEQPGHRLFETAGLRQSIEGAGRGLVTVQGFPKQPGLAAECCVEAGRRDPDRGRQVADRHPLVAMAPEQAHRGVDRQVPVKGARAATSRSNLPVHSDH